MILLAASRGPVPAIFAKLEADDRLTEEEIAQFLMYIWALTTHHWQVYHQHQKGMETCQGHSISVCQSDPMF